MDEATRLSQLVTELGSDEGYASGRRSFPRTVTPADAAEIAAAFQSELDVGVEARARAVERQGHHIACARGCNYCCEEPVLVFRLEAVRVARWLAAPENAATRARFVDRYPAWRDASGDVPARLGELAARGDDAAYKRLQVEGWRRRVLCAFNRDGECSIYPVRPLVCRYAHAVDTKDKCHPESQVPATRFEFVPLERFRARARGVMRAAHHALGGPRARPEALCDAVASLLSA